jgi:hypothetical protein
VSTAPAPRDPGRDPDPPAVPPGDPDDYPDPDNAPPAPGDAELAALLAGARQVTAGRAYDAEVAARLGHIAARGALEAVSAGRCGPGMPGSAQTYPGGVCQPGGRVRVRQAAGYRAGLRHPRLVPGAGGRG